MCGGGCAPLSGFAYLSMRKQKQALVFLSLFALALTLALGVRSNPSDFNVYYQAGQSLFSGRTDLYAANFALGATLDYRYPPLFLLLSTPLWKLPYNFAWVIWYILEFGALLGSVLVVHRVTRISRHQFLIWTIAFVTIEQYVVFTLRNGNVHSLLICLVFAALWLSRQKQFTAALLLALAISIKPIPLILLPYFVASKQLRLTLMVAVLLVLFNLAPAGYFGFRQNSELLKTWFTKVVWDPNDFHELNGPVNLSLRGQLRRYLTAVDYSQRADRYPPVNALSLAPRVADQIYVWTAGLLLVGATAFSWQRVGASSQVTNEVLQQGLFLCLMIVLLPSSPKDYFLALLWPVVALGGFAFGRSGRAALVCRVLLLVAACLSAVLPLLPGRSFQRLLEVIGFDFLIALIISIGLVYAIITHRRKSQVAR
jgi:Glycosyltransferase family 87